MNNTKEGLKNLFNSVKAGKIGIGTATKMILGGHVGSGFLPTVGSKGPGTRLEKSIRRISKAKGGIIKKRYGGSIKKKKGKK
jgi:hypothetical protein